MPADIYKDAVPGDRPSASEWNKLAGNVESLDGDANPYGQQSIKTAGIRGQAQNTKELLVVRITGTIVPQSSDLAEDAESYLVDVDGNTGEDACNAVVQIYDDDAGGWVDSPSGDAVTVVVNDSQPGWRPLVINDVIPVQWKRIGSIYVPMDSRETGVVMATGGRDGDGYYPGVIMGFASETGTWVTRGTCYILDIGS